MTPNERNRQDAKTPRRREPPLTAVDLALTFHDLELWRWEDPRRWYFVDSPHRAGRRPGWHVRLYRGAVQAGGSGGASLDSAATNALRAAKRNEAAE